MNPLAEMIQQYGPLIGILAAAATVLGVAFGIYKASHNRHVVFLRERLHQLEQQLKKCKEDDPEVLRQLVDQLRSQIDELKRGKAKEEAQQVQLRDEIQSKERSWREKSGSLTAELEKTREELSESGHERDTRANLLKRALKLEGRVWERKVLRGIPRFRPLHERHTAILSVLNLKGGVGKTTVTAHLGAALAAKGYRVLLVDLDLQGSLSSMFISESILTKRSESKLLLQHFLTGAAEKRRANLLEYRVPIFNGESAIVPTADSMAYAELNLTMRWLLRIGKKDNRFLLRRALHQKRVTHEFDIILLDCPPIFNTCCVNALTASDYILIPVMPSRKAAERVPLLLNRLKRLCSVTNPDLQIAGILLNRTRGLQLTAWEEDLWRDLRERSQDQWKLPVHAFETFIRQTTEVRDSETEFSSPEPGSELSTLFSQLVVELEARLPRDCRRTATAPLGPK
jgi:cellulose biosynthesis protein BcsQ